MFENKFLIQEDTANTTDAVGTNTIDFGLAEPGVNKSGDFGLHVIVTTTFTGLDEGVNMGVVHSASDDISTGSEVHTSMLIPVDEMVAGAHFFLPLCSRKLLQYVGTLFDAVSTAASAGKTTQYLGPRVGGEG